MSHLRVQRGSSSGDSTLGEDESVWIGKTIYALIPEPTEQENEHRRIGVAEIPEEKFKIEKWDLETVTVVERHISSATLGEKRDRDCVMDMGSSRTFH